MKQIEKFISPFIKNQFPEFYKEEGDNFVSFVTEYYKWLEENNNIIYNARRLPDYSDIDTTIDEFVVFYQKKFAPNIKFQIESNKQLFIKNVLPFYRAKGTPRAVDLFFKLIYGVSSKIYNPSKDIFKLSDGVWSAPKYFQIKHTEKNKSFIGKTIYGSLSGASCFVDDYIVKKVSGTYVGVLYISNIVGNFKIDDILYVDRKDLEGNPIIRGNLNGLTIESGGVGFSVGDSINIYSPDGSFGKGIVTETKDITGLVDFNLKNGGFGYNSNSEILVADKNIVIGDCLTTNIPLFKEISQKTISFTVTNISNTFNVGDRIYKYYANSAILATATIVKVVDSGSNANILVSKETGNIESYTSNTIYNSGNVSSGNVTAYSTITATANVIAVDTSFYFYTNQLTNSLLLGETIRQNDSVAKISNVYFDGVKYKIGCYEANGEFNYLSNITSSSSNVSITPTFFDVKIGIKNISNTFYVEPQTSLGGNTIIGYCNYISSGENAGFSFASNATFDNLQTVNTNTDFISDFGDVPLNATAFGFYKRPISNLTSGTLYNTLNFENINFGTITNKSIIAVNGGKNYTDTPLITIREKLSAGRNYKNVFLYFSQPTSSFLVGETVREAYSNGVLVANGAKGIIVSSNSTMMEVSYTSVFNRFDFSEDNNPQIKGDLSKSSANLISVVINEKSNMSGLNGIVVSNTAYGNGSVTALSIINSGFGYSDGEDVIFYNSSNSSITGSAKVTLGSVGIREGEAIRFGGLLSENKKIYDGNYYQEYSYEVQTKLPVEIYADMFKKTIHVAGTQFFGKLVNDSEILIGIDSNSEKNSYVLGDGTVSVSNTDIIVGNGTKFKLDFYAGKKIKIESANTSTIKTIVSVDSNTVITLSSNVTFSNNNCKYFKII